MRAKRRLAGGVRLRRGRRTDAVDLRALLPEPTDARAERFARRTLGDPSHDVYVAEGAGGALVGVMTIAYVRSLASGRWVAVLDTARAAPAPGRLLHALLELGEERARRRGCRHVWTRLGPDDAALRAALTSRGWQVDEVFVGALDIER